MTNLKRVGNLVSLLAMMVSGLALAAQPASAQATRTWVSGVGNDANPCSRTAPCKTFAGAISKTATGGEINALDPGGFGAVTITKSITIDGGGGQVASVLAAGTNGIIVNAPAGSLVTLRNLRINGVGLTPTPGLNGVQFLAGLAVLAVRSGQTPMKSLAAAVETLRRVNIPIAGLVLNETTIATDATHKAYARYYTTIGSA